MVATVLALAVLCGPVAAAQDAGAPSSPATAAVVVAAITEPIPTTTAPPVTVVVTQPSPGLLPGWGWFAVGWAAIGAAALVAAATVFAWVRMSRLPAP
jgi:hypothetical protein